MTDEQPKPSSAETDPVGHAQKIASRVASSHPEESANALHKLGLLVAKNKASQKLADLLTSEAPYLLNGGGKTRAELETRVVELERQNEDLFTTNRALGEQNEAIFNENTRLRRPGMKEKIAGAMRRLTDIFTPAAAADGSDPRKGFLRSAFAASVPGALAAVALMTGVPPYPIVLFVGMCVFPLSFMAVLDSFRNPCLSPGRILGGTMTGMALSAALVFGAASYGQTPEKPADPAPQGAAIERPLPAAATVKPADPAPQGAAIERPLPAAATVKPDIPAGKVMEDGTVYAGVSPGTGKPFYTTPKDPDMVVTWPEANEYCENLTAHGHNDWRLPTGKKMYFAEEEDNELKQMFLQQFNIQGFKPDKDAGKGSVFYYTLPQVYSARNMAKDIPNKAMTRDFTSPDVIVAISMKDKASFRCVRG